MDIAVSFAFTSRCRVLTAGFFFRLGESCSLNAELMSSFRVSNDGALF